VAEHGVRGCVGQVQQRHGYRADYLIRDCVHGVRADQQEVTTGRLEPPARLGEHLARLVPAVLRLHLLPASSLLLHFLPAFKEGYGATPDARGSSQRPTVAGAKVRGHHQIPVIRQTSRQIRLARAGASRITDDLQSMLDTMARQGEYSDYARMAALDPATGTPPGAAEARTT